MSTTVASVIGAVAAIDVAGTVALAIALAKTREKLVKLEEWVRLHNGGK